MSLYENLIALVNKYFYKTEEKPIKYSEWLISEYINGKWFLGEPVQYTVIQQSIISVEEHYDNGTYQCYITVSIGDSRQGIDAYPYIEADIHEEGEDVSKLNSYDNEFIIQTNFSPRTITISPYTDKDKGIKYNGCVWHGTPTTL